MEGKNMNRLNKNKTGLAIGSFYAVFHFGWAVMVAAGIAKPFADWVLSLHFMTLTYSINAFQIGTAALLVVYAFAAGYVLGWGFAAVWNKFQK